MGLGEKRLNLPVGEAVEGAWENEGQGGGNTVGENT